MSDSILLSIRTDRLRPSPLNPRKTFDDAKLQDLANSLRAVGLLEPLVVRPDRTHPEQHEIICGERRYRASLLAELPDLLCIVRKLSDVEALEIMTVENLQRDDLHPLEEAEGYAALMKSAGYDVDAIAAKVGKSKKYVYDRVKLLQLVPELREIFMAGEIQAGHAILLARLSREDQLASIGDPGDGYYDGGLFEEDWDHDDDAPELDLEDGATPKRRAKSVRELTRWIRDNVRLRLDDGELPDLFPEVAVAVDEADQKALEVVHITRSWQGSVQIDGDGPKLYFSNQWKRADGKSEGYGDKGQACDHAVLGVVVLGGGQGEAFNVCIDRTCKVHWKTERAARTSSTSRQSAQDRKWAEERKAADAERARWKKAQPALRKALAEKLATTPATQLTDLILKRALGYGRTAPKDMKRGKTVDDAIRYIAFCIIEDKLGDWNVAEAAPKALKPFGIDAKKIVDQVAPKPKPKKEPKAKASTNGKKKAAKAAKKKGGARARRRAKKASADVSTSAG